MSAVIDKISAVGNDSVEVEPVGRIELGPELFVRYAIIRDVDYPRLGKSSLPVSHSYYQSN